ncbi:hypothetical protein HYPDE_32038 [Hyphomicrobium denitrificans 1NES1]|uniref:Uncharacterized protein n=1 Tax=Hyphomicrobium denitrificans 1NES1 TaxID=670307 RepID=N0B778_9HYPH|nr:TIGR02594 family protein [Hyphomicrobium denitrificans]AGK58082.1 hypothetical protein HYPDE_32038 [Hyphomicrobium denitrificans 1NES1]
MDQPPWLAAAWAEFGVREISGKDDAPEILRYFREAGDTSVETEATPWCAAFLGAMLRRAGYVGTGSLLARSYLDWGDPLDAARLGAVVVLSRGDDPNAGHVGFLLSDTNGKLYLLGGNQGDAVTVAGFDKARLLGLRWPKENIEPENTGDDTIFLKALAHVLDMEGGYSNDPYDPGGPTNRGITLDAYAAFKSEAVDDVSRARLIAELKRIPDATVTAIYRQCYFDPASCPVFTAPLALMHFDAAVNHGVGAAIRMLQGVVDVTADGEIGPDTLAAIGAKSLSDLLDDYAEMRRTRYRALPHFWRFGRGWLKRVDATLALARTWAAADATNRGLLEPRQIAKGESKMGNATDTQSTDNDDSKWWVRSKTVWGTLITAAATVIPAIGPALGIALPADIIQTFGDQAITAVQALAGLFGTVLAIYGRLKADTPLALHKS